jgi:hypothetical protein
MSAIGHEQSVGRLRSSRSALMLPRAFKADQMGFKHAP